VKILDSTIFAKQLQQTELDPFIPELNCSEHITTTVLLQRFVSPDFVIPGVRTSYFSDPAAIVRSIPPQRGGNMLHQVNQTEARDLEWSCQSVSFMDEPCECAETFHCGICGQWFCAVHVDDETWHTCVLEPGEEGGEGLVVFLD
jgi:hypothetical protein